VRTTRTAGLAWLAVLIFIAAYEVWAVHTGTPTLSQFVWRMDDAHGWFRYAVLSGIAVLMIHFFWRRRRTTAKAP